MKKQLTVSYQEIISLENLFAGWQEFVRGKRSKRDVQEFGLHLADNILELRQELVSFKYHHGPYKAFNVSDPKPRSIHKAEVRDRLLHHAIYHLLYPFFDRTFIADSYSCRVGKGTHKALSHLRAVGRIVSKNNTHTAWVLKCDVKKFFASIDHKILLEILKGRIPEKSIVWLLNQVIKSFNSGISNKGLPLGNLTSQLFCNIYMNEFDQFVKHKLKAKYYLRYADDFVFLSESRDSLVSLVSGIAIFLQDRLKLTLHPDKIFIKTLASGVDFLGWVHFPHHRVLRRTTRNRMFRRIRQHKAQETLQSYLGLVRHGNTFKLTRELLNWHGLFAPTSD